MRSQDRELRAVINGVHEVKTPLTDSRNAKATWGHSKRPRALRPMREPSPILPAVLGLPEASRRSLLRSQQECVVLALDFSGLTAHPQKRFLPTIRAGGGNETNRGNSGSSAGFFTCATRHSFPTLYFSPHAEPERDMRLIHYVRNQLLQLLDAALEIPSFYLCNLRNRTARQRPNACFFCT